MTISIDIEKASDKIQHLFLIKSLNKLGIEGNFLYLIKVIHEKSTGNIIFNGERLNAFSLRSEQARMSSNILLEFLVSNIRQEK